MNKFAITAIFCFAFSSLLHADPGENTTLSVCEQEPQFEMIGALLGMPDSGGMWTDPEGEAVPDGIFIPGTSSDGIYTYTIDAGDGPESATLDITSINCPGSPPNDACGSAQFLNPATDIPFSTFGATTDGPAHFGPENCEVNGESQIENDVWYIYLPECDGEATISTVGGTTLNTKIAVYTFVCPPTTDQLIACNEDFGSGYQSSLTWQFEMGQVYLIRLGESPGPGSGNGTFNFSETCEGEEPPANQFCADATVVTPGPGIAFSTFNAVTDGPSHEGDNTCTIFSDPANLFNDVWYSYTATCEGTAIMSTLDGTTLDTRIAVYSETCPTDLFNLVACNDDFQGSGQSEVAWDIAAGETYLLRLGNSELSNGGSGTFSLSENCGQEPPANDFCDTAQVITPAFGIPFNTLGATTDGPSHFQSPICDFFGSPQIDNDVWYEYTASCDGMAEVSTVGGTSLDTRLAVYAVYCPQDLTNLVTCNDDDGSPQSTVEWNVTSGDTYYIRLGEFPGSGGGFGTFNLIETCDETVCAMPVIGYNTHCNGLDDFESFYVQATVVTIGNVGPYTITPNIGGDFQQVNETGVYEFGPFDNDETVVLVVESDNNETCIDASYELSANCYPENFNFTCGDLFEAQANQYTSYTNVESFTWGDALEGATCGFTQIHNDLWYAYTAGCTGQVTWQNCALSDFDTRMAVYENTCESGDLELLACSEPDDCGEFAASVSFQANQGSTYVMRIGSTSENESGIGVFLIEEEVNLVSAGTDTTLTYCDTFEGSIILNQFLGEGAEPDGDWSDDDNSGALLGNVVFFNSLDSPGTYDFTYTVSGPCNDDVATITVEYTLCSGVEESAGNMFRIFPNPANGNFSVTAGSGSSQLSIQLIDLSGRIVFDQTLHAESDGRVLVKSDDDLSTGIYFVRIGRLNDGYTETQKIVIR